MLTIGKMENDTRNFFLVPVTFTLLLLGFALVAFSCDDLFTGEKRKKVSNTEDDKAPQGKNFKTNVCNTKCEKTIVAKAGKANFLVLTNVGKATSGNISVTQQQDGMTIQKGQEITEEPKESLEFQNWALPDVELENEDSLFHEHAELPDVPPLIPAQYAQSLNGDAPLYMLQKGSAEFSVGGSIKFNVQTKPNRYKDLLFNLKKKMSLNHDNETYMVHYWVHIDPEIYGDQKFNDTNIENIAEKFSGQSPNILGTSIDIFGKPWGSHKIWYLIPGKTRSIHLLFFDIQGDKKKTTGGVVGGYFHAKDNYRNSKDSNEKLILNIDIPFVSKNPQAIYPIIIHELQHMIHFYQKTVRHNMTYSTLWLNEMLSEAAVDLVAPRIGLKNNELSYHYHQRIGGYLMKTWTPLGTWKKDNPVPYHNTVNAFAAYLLRHHAPSRKSAELAKRIVHNQYTDRRAITSEVNATWEELLQDWSKQTLFSYQANGQLAQIKPWEIIKRNSSDFVNINIGISMFYLNPPSNVHQKAKNRRLFLNQQGIYTEYYFSNVPNRMEFPQPGGHVFIYLGKFNQDTKIQLKLTRGIAYDLVTH